MSEEHLIIFGLLPFALYGYYKFLKWVMRKDRENGLE